MSARTEYVETTDIDTNLEKETENFLNRISRDVFYDKDKRDRDKRAEKRKIRPDTCTKNSACKIPEHMPMGIFHPRHVHTFQRYLKQILILFTLFISSNLEFSGRLCCLCSFEAYCFELLLDHVQHLHGADFGFHVSWNSLTKRLNYYRDLYKQTERVGYTYPCEICYQELK